MISYCGVVPGDGVFAVKGERGLADGCARQAYPGEGAGDRRAAAGNGECGVDCAWAGSADIGAVVGEHHRESALDGPWKEAADNLHAAHILPEVVHDNVLRSLILDNLHSGKNPAEAVDVCHYPAGGIFEFDGHIFVTLTHNEIEAQVAAPFVAGGLCHGVGDKVLYFHIVIGACGEQTDRELHLKVALIEHQLVTAGYETYYIFLDCRYEIIRRFPYHFS